VWGLDLVDPL
jgi:transposase InsO family protein